VIEWGAARVQHADAGEADMDERNRNAHVDQNKVPNNLLVNEPSLSTQEIGGSCGR
jgi:hypothetical protein